MVQTEVLQVATNYAKIFTVLQPTNEQFVRSSDLRHSTGRCRSRPILLTIVPRTIAVRSAQ